MPARSPALRQSAARAGAAARWGKPDAEDARRDLAAARLEAYIKKLVDSAPPLTSEQRDKLVVLLRSRDERGLVT